MASQLVLYACTSRIHGGRGRVVRSTQPRARCAAASAIRDLLWVRWRRSQATKTMIYVLRTHLLQGVGRATAAGENNLFFYLSITGGGRCRQKKGFASVPVILDGPAVTLIV